MIMIIIDLYFNFIDTSFITFYILILFVSHHCSGISISTNSRRNVSATLLIEGGYFFQKEEATSQC